MLFLTVFSTPYPTSGRQTAKALHTEGFVLHFQLLTGFAVAEILCICEWLS